MRAKVVLAAMGLLAAIPLLALTRRPPAPDPAPASSDQGPTWTIEGLHLADWDPDGTHWRLTADRGYGEEAGTTGELQGVKVAFERKGQIVKLRAENAEFDGGDELQLGGGVEITWDGYAASVDRAVYQRGSGEIRSADPVTLQGPGLRVEGRGVEVDVEGRVARILSKVQAVMSGDGR